MNSTILKECSEHKNPRKYNVLEVKHHVWIYNKIIYFRQEFVFFYLMIPTSVHIKGQIQNEWNTQSGFFNHDKLWYKSTRFVCTNIECVNVSHLFFSSYFFKCEQTLTANPKGISKNSFRSFLSSSNKAAPLTCSDLNFSTYGAQSGIDSMNSQTVCTLKEKNIYKMYNSFHNTG